ncbi:energy transducer TonB [Psychromonas aquatilis]|uniref:Protein TonB n=1 Tax=Psychromonas aquatilis TaxID=2005072 RepID=A0ABU9GMI7_9GAMM
MYMRYLLAFIISFSAHALLFSQPEPEKIVKMNTAQAASLPIQFVALPAPKPVPEPVVQQPTPPPKKVEKVTPKPDLPKRIIKDEPKVVKKKEVKKPKPKPVPKKTPKPVVKKPTPKKVEKVAPKEVQKQVTKPTEAPKIKQANTKQTTGVNSKPTLVEKSRFLSPPTPPKYPRSAKRRGIEGTVTYEVWLDEKGKLDKIVLKNSSGARDLDKAALKAIKRWKFSPHRINGQSVAHRLYVPIKFELEN